MNSQSQTTSGDMEIDQHPILKDSTRYLAFLLRLQEQSDSRYLEIAERLQDLNRIYLIELSKEMFRDEDQIKICQRTRSLVDMIYSNRFPHDLWNNSYDMIMCFLADRWEFESEEERVERRTKMGQLMKILK